MGIIVGDVETISVDDTDTVTVVFKHLLVDDTITGSPTAVELTTSDLTITGVGFNAAAIIADRIKVPIAKAVQFVVSGGLDGTTYTIKVTVTTASSRTLAREVRLKFD